MSIERRYLTGEEIETRAETDATGKRFIMGYFSLNNTNSVQITERINGNVVTFTERIAPDAFKDADLSDVIYNVEHDSTRPIARTGANLKVNYTERGLFARAEIPAEAEATTEQNDLLKLVNQKVIRGNSFAFSVGGDEWYRQDGNLYRNITKINRVVDITSTVQPAYPDTFVFTRSLNEESIKDVSTSEVKPVKYDSFVVNTDFEFSLLKSKQF